MNVENPEERGLICLGCGYDLRGLVASRCPECSLLFNHASSLASGVSKPTAFGLLRIFLVSYSILVAMLGEHLLSRMGVDPFGRLLWGGNSGVTIYWALLSAFEVSCLLSIAVVWNMRPCRRTAAWSWTFFSLIAAFHELAYPMWHLGVFFPWCYRPPWLDFIPFWCLGAPLLVCSLLPVRPNGYLNTLQSLCKKHRIGILFPLALVATGAMISWAHDPGYWGIMYIIFHATLFLLCAGGLIICVVCLNESSILVKRLSHNSELGCR